MRYVPSAAKSTLIGRILASHPHVLSGYTLIRRRRSSFEVEAWSSIQGDCVDRPSDQGRPFWFEATTTWL